MKTLLFGIALGVAAKCLWDSEYGDELRESVNNWWAGIMDNIDDKIVKAESAIEKATGKLDDAMNS